MIPYITLDPNFAKANRVLSTVCLTYSLAYISLGILRGSIQDHMAGPTVFLDTRVVTYKKYELTMAVDDLPTTLRSTVSFKEIEIRENSLFYGRAK